MSFGFSISDAILLTQLARNTVQNARKACGEYDELTQQVSALHIVLRRFQKEASVERGEGQSDSPKREHQDSYNAELHTIVSGCEKVLGTLDKILKKYNSLSERERGRRPKMLWKKVRFGNGEIADLGELRGKVVYHASLLTFFLNLRSTGSIGRVEQQMNDAGGHLKEIKGIVNGIAAVQLSQPHQEGSILSAHTNDDRSAWKDIRRELRHEHGFHDADLRKHKAVIVDYITELGRRGVFDERDLNEDKEEHEGHNRAAVQADVATDEDSEALRDTDDRHLESDLGHRGAFDERDLNEDKEENEGHNRAAVQADVAIDEDSEALRDTDDRHLESVLNVPSDITSEDDACDEGQSLAGSGDESLLESLFALQKRFDEDYMPSCLEFLSAPPKDEESCVERHTLLSDGILTDILLKFPPIDLDSSDSSDSPKAQIHDFSNQIQRWLSKLDEAVKENTTEWLVQLSDRLYNGLVVQFIDASVRQDSYETQRKEAYAMMRKKISQDLILLDDIEVDGSQGLRIVKANIKGDLNAMRNAISKVEKTAKWEWKDQRSHPSPALIPRVVLKISNARNEIVSREVASIDLIRYSSLNCYGANKSVQDVCISCRRAIGDSRRELCFPCDHVWCDSCTFVLLEFPFADPGFMPLQCCGEGPLALDPVAKWYDATLDQRWWNAFLDTTGHTPYHCPLNTCGNPRESYDFHWFERPTECRGYSQCSDCKSLHFLKMTMREHSMTVEHYCYDQRPTFTPPNAHSKAVITVGTSLPQGL